MRRVVILSLTIITFALTAFAESSTRTFEATYTATISDIPANAGVLNVWIPIPRTRHDQQITNVKVDGPYAWKRMQEKEFGDHYVFAKVPAPMTGQLIIHVTFQGTRRPVAAETVANVTPTKSELARALRADRMVTLSPRIRKLADELTAGKTTVTDQAQAIYQYVMTTMKYDKSIPGWGNGDTERACDIKAGNCTDFHSLFLSLARAKAIPARFLIGFPLPDADGKSPGYHCWAEFYVAGKGWIPIDASEASKTTDPSLRAFYFGNLAADRVEFTRGRDLVLDPATAAPLNFFIYPHAEANGKTIGTPSIALEIHDVKGGPNVSTSAAR